MEHWDNAQHQGKAAGRNMAGAREPFTYMPYFFSDLFDFGYEAVGEVSASLQTFADWQSRISGSMAADASSMSRAALAIAAIRLSTGIMRRPRRR